MRSFGIVSNNNGNGQIDKIVNESSQGSVYTSLASITISEDFEHLDKGKIEKLGIQEVDKLRKENKQKWGAEKPQLEAMMKSGTATSYIDRYLGRVKDINGVNLERSKSSMSSKYSLKESEDTKDVGLEQRSEIKSTKETESQRSLKDIRNKR